MVLSAGFQLGRYSILSEIGKGGMGEVYRAIDTRLNRNVAIKVLPADVASDKERMSAFIREAKAASAIDHPNIVHVYEIDQAEDVNFIAMQYVEGETLSNKISGQPLAITEFLQIAIQIIDAIAEAHTRGIVHRDLKPANIMISNKGHPRLLDFGLARIQKIPESSELSQAQTWTKTKPGTIAGTISYMSPEQALGKTIDHRTDIFSMGVVFYEMATGRRPFSGSNPTETIDKIVHSQPESIARFNYNIPQELERVIRKCMEKDPDRRYQSASDLLIDLRNLNRDLDSSNIKQEIERGTTETITPSKQNYLIPIALFLIAAIIASIYFFTRPAKTIDSLAILPFANISGNPDMEYLGDGITESLINNLSQLPRLRVMARTTVFTYKGRSVDPRRVGKEMNVRAVLTGKLNRIGDTLLIQGELVDASDGSQLWGEQYSEKFTDILTVQGIISKQIAEKLRHKLTGEQEKLLTKAQTANSDAYQLYLKGLYFRNKRTPDGLLKSIGFYQQAIATDPNYALAYAGLASTISTQVMVSDAAPKECFPKAKEAALKALQIDDSLADAHAILLYVKNHYDWDWPGVEREFKRTMQLNPNHGEAHAWYGGYLAKMGRYTEGLAENKRAQELDPLSLYLNTLLGTGYLRARQYDQAIEQYRKTLEMDPHYYPARIRLAEAYKQKRMYQQALDELNQADEVSGHYSESLSLIGYIYAITGRHEEAQKMINKLKERSTHRYVSPYHIAVIHSGLGEKDVAFEWLQKAYVDRSMLLTFINVSPIFDNLRSDPRFADLLQRLNLRT